MYFSSFSQWLFKIFTANEYQFPNVSTGYQHPCSLITCISVCPEKVIWVNPPICVSKIKPSLASGGDLSVMDCIILGTLKSVDPVPVPTHIYIYITLTITCVWGQQNHSLNDTLSYSVPERIGKTVAVESLSVVICLFLCGPVSISPPLYLLIMPHYTLELTLERTGSPGVALCY